MSFTEIGTKNREEINLKKMQIYSETIDKLIRIITRQCYERGRLLTKVWREYKIVIKEIIENNEIARKLKDQKLNDIAVSIITKYKDKVKKSDEKVEDMKKNIEICEDESNSLRIRIGQLMEKCLSLEKNHSSIMKENRLLRIDNIELKQINKVLRDYFFIYKPDKGKFVIV